MGEIKLDAHNYRIHDDKNLKLIKRSLKKLGAGRSILIDADGVIIAGNATYQTAQELGIPVETIKIDGSKVVALQRTDLHTQDKERKEMALMDNTTSANPNYDYGEIQTDFSADELPSLGIEDIPTLAEENAEIVEDEVPEEVETRCKKGDIWQLGEHRLMCGDSTVITDVEKLMNGEKADMVFTDPPYGMNLDTDFSSMKSKMFKGKTGGADYNPVIGDNEDFKPELINTIFSLFGYVREMFIFGADYFAELLPKRNDGSWIVWDKRLDESADKMYGSCFELCWSKNKHKRDIARVKWAGIFGMEKEDTTKRVHPTQKPIALISYFLNNFSKENDLVIDLFGGSGSTIIACEQLKRKCYMCEIDPHYCDVIITRWETLTGKHAQRIE